MRWRPAQTTIWLNPSVLPSRELVYWRAREIIDLQTELIGARESLIFSTTHDSMTHLSNRAEIISFLEREMARGSREHRPVGVVLADIDHFKKVNDTLGHLSGDAVLKDVARKLRSELRVYDGVGRYGGEEFLLVLPAAISTVRSIEQKRSGCA